MSQAINAVEESASPLDDFVAGPHRHGYVAWSRFMRRRLALVGLAILIVMAMAAIFAPLLTRYGMNQQNLFVQLQGPSSSHPLGTDDLGQDVLTRLLYGGRVSLSIGFLATLVSSVIGVVVGVTAGYFGGLVDNILMRIVDLLLAFPAIFLLLILFSMIQASALTVVIFLGSFGWLYLARIVRSECLSLREEDFVEAARVIGGTSFRTITRHMLPNVVGPVIVTATLGVAYNMLAEASLDFLGFGVPPDVPTWGNMLTGAEEFYLTAPLLAIVPGLTLTVAILSVNFVGDGLRDTFDTRTV